VSSVFTTGILNEIAVDLNVYSKGLLKVTTSMTIILLDNIMLN